ELDLHPHRALGRIPRGLPDLTRADEARVGRGRDAGPEVAPARRVPARRRPVAGPEGVPLPRRVGRAPDDACRVLIHAGLPPHAVAAALPRVLPLAEAAGAVGPSAFARG